VFDEVSLNALNSGVSATLHTAWELTRRLSPRADVRVMKRDAYGRLDENSYPSFHRVSPAAPATPWCMLLADETGLFRLLCFDFDGKDKHGVDAELMERAVDDSDALSHIFDELGIAHVVCQSSGTGGRHIWVALRDGAAASVVAAVARSARANYRTLDHGMLLNVAQGAARPPLAPHRDGSASTVLRGDLDTLTTPSTTAADLNALAVALSERAPALHPAQSTPAGPLDIGHTAHRALSSWGAGHMATVEGGNNPSWTAFMCLLAAAHAGWSIQDVEHAARTAPGMEHFRTKNTGRGTRRPRGATEAAERLHRQWTTAQQYAAVQRPLPAPHEPKDLTQLTTIVETVEDLLARFDASPGRWGHSEASINEQTILRAVAYLTLHTGKRIVAAAIRDLALMTGLGRTTAARSLLALQHSGYLQRVTATDAGNAAEWQFVDRLSTPSRTVRPHPLNNPRPPTDLFNSRAELIGKLEQQLTDQRHDLFTRAGLGHLAGKSYALLRQFPALTVDTAAKILGVTARHTATILSRLRQHKLIIKHQDGWARAKRDLRDRAARIVGVAGMLMDRARRYQAEREVWAWWQAELITMTTAPQRRPRRPHVSSRTLEFVETPGERLWPRYPRGRDGRGDHREARYWATNGMLDPGSLWISTTAA